MAQKNSQDGLERLGFLTTSDSHVSELRAVNDELKGVGVYLTEKGIYDVLSSRQSSLARQARLQWSLEMTEQLLERAANSPYAEQDTLPQIISDWFEVILFIQNQTSDFLADEDIIFAVSEYFDNYCGGDADLLRGKAADRIVKNYQMKKSLARGCYDTPGRQNMFDDEEAHIEPEEAPVPTSDIFRRNIFAVREPQASAAPVDSGLDSEAGSDSGNEAGTEAETDADAALHSEKAGHASQPQTQLRRQMNHPDEEAHEILALFQKELNRYVGDGATSVSEKAGRNIFASIRYTLSAAPNKNLPIEQSFCDGQRRLLFLMEQSETNFRAVLAMKIHLPLDTYYGTLYREIPAFFRLYDAQYAAHETPSLMDYPLAIEIENLSGILYMHEYLRRIRMESEYVHRISEELCTELVEAYGRKYDMDVTSVPVNFFEIMMGQAFAVALVRDIVGKRITSIWEAPAARVTFEGDGTADEKAEGDSAADEKPEGDSASENSSDTAGADQTLLPDSWLMSPLAYEPALLALLDMSVDAQRKTLDRICDDVCRYPDASGPETEEYAHIYADRWITLFQSALLNHCPENLILFPARISDVVSSEEPSYFVLGEPMPDEEYTELVEKLSAAQDADEQNQLIRANVHSRKDLLDILQEDFWMPGEKDIFLSTFSAEEQALFAKEGEPDAPQLGKK